jgi:hypothetical protein
LDAADRQAKETDYKRWANYREAKHMVVQMYKKLNKNKNICVHMIIFITFRHMIKKIHNLKMYRVNQFIREILEKAKSKKIGFHWQWNHYMKSKSLNDRIKNEMR